MTKKISLETKLESLPEIVKKLCTKQLRKELHSLRLIPVEYTNFIDKRVITFRKQAIKIIKQELSTREPIPNRREARKIKQERAKNRKLRNSMFRK